MDKYIHLLTRLKDGPKFKPIKDKDTPKHLEMLERTDRLAKDEVKDYLWELLRDALIWAVKDDFWMYQFRSCLGLRSKSSRNACYKYENIIAAFEKNHYRTYGREWQKYSGGGGSNKPSICQITYYCATCSGMFFRDCAIENKPTAPTHVPCACGGLGRRGDV